MMTEDELVEAVLATPLSDAARISQLQDCVELMSRIAQTGDAKKVQEAAELLDKARSAGWGDSAHAVTYVRLNLLYVQGPADARPRRRWWKLF